MNVTSRRLGPSDLQLAESNCSLFWQMDSCSINLESFLALPGNILLAGFADGESAGQVLGYVLPRWDSGKPMLFFYSVDVLSKYRRQGIGKMLIREFNILGSSLGCGKSFVMTDSKNEEAMALYRSAGGKLMAFTDVMFQWDISELPVPEV